MKQEIQEGPAQILCTVDESTRFYDVQITAVHLDHDNVNRGIELKVTDPELLELTGGIVQGMSGSPIIQNGKFIGAVTHVLVQDSAKGYGIFIENMLERGQEKCSRVFVYGCAFLSDSYNLSYSLARRHQRVVYIWEGE